MFGRYHDGCYSGPRLDRRIERSTNLVDFSSCGMLMVAYSVLHRMTVCYRLLKSFWRGSSSRMIFEKKTVCGLFVMKTSKLIVCIVSLVCAGIVFLDAKFQGHDEVHCLQHHCAPKFMCSLFFQ